MATEWYYQIMGETFGPMSAAQLREKAQAGEISADTWVRNGAEGDWMTADRIQGLLQQNRVSLPPKPVPNRDTKASALPSDQATTTARRLPERRLIYIFAVGIVAILAIPTVYLLTRPGSSERKNDGGKNAGTHQRNPESPAHSVPANSETAIRSFEDAFREGQIDWQPVKNIRLTTHTAGMTRTQSFDFVTNYDALGQPMHDSGQRSYGWRDRQATFGSGAVIRITEDAVVREGVLRAGDEWTWTGQRWITKPKIQQPRATESRNTEHAFGSGVPRPGVVPPGDSSDATTSPNTPEWRRSVARFFEEVDRYRQTTNKFPQTSYSFLAEGGEVPTTWEVMRLYGGQIEWEGVFEGFDAGSKLEGRGHKLKVSAPAGIALHVYPSRDAVTQWQTLRPNSRVRYRATIEGIAAFAIASKSGRPLVVYYVSLKDAVPLRAM